VRTVFVVEFLVGALAWGVLVVDYLHERWWTSAPGRQLMAAWLVGLGEFAAFGLLVVGVPVPVWLFAVGFAAVDAVAIGWVVLRWRARRDERRRRGHG
jgi:hypothetical protein